VVVGTPGRVCALLEKGDFVTPSVRLLILDEVNVLMADTFKGDVCWMHSVFPRPIQVKLAFPTLLLVINEIDTTKEQAIKED
jgi:superfamily II DNA/RNA helicase